MCYESRKRDLNGTYDLPLLYIYIWGLDDNPLDPPQTNETHTFKGGVGGEGGESQCSTYLFSDQLIDSCLFACLLPWVLAPGDG